MRRPILVALAGLALSACGGTASSPTPTAAPARPTAAPAPTTTPVIPTAAPLPFALPETLPTLGASVTDDSSLDGKMPLSADYPEHWVGSARFGVLRFRLGFDGTAPFDAGQVDAMATSQRADGDPDRAMGRFVNVTFHSAEWSAPRPHDFGGRSGLLAFGRSTSEDSVAALIDVGNGFVALYWARVPAGELQARLPELMAIAASVRPAE